MARSTRSDGTLVRNDGDDAPAPSSSSRQRGMSTPKKPGTGMLTLGWAVDQSRRVLRARRRGRKIQPDGGGTPSSRGTTVSGGESGRAPLSRPRNPRAEAARRRRAAELARESSCFYVFLHLIGARRLRRKPQPLPATPLRVRDEATPSRMRSAGPPASRGSAMRFVPTAGEHPGAHDQLWKTQSPASRGFGGGREDERVLGDAQSDGMDPTRRQLSYD